MKDTQPTKNSGELTTAEGLAIMGNVLLFIATLSSLMASGALTHKQWIEIEAVAAACSNNVVCELQQLLTQLDAVKVSAALTAVFVPATLYVMYQLYKSMEKGT